METAYLETLIVISELGSFSAAALRLHVTQSALSRRVALLEQQLGVELLDRSGSTVTCTEAGRCVVDSARQILLIENQIPQLLANLGRASRISLGCTRGFGATYLQALLEQAQGQSQVRRTVVTMEATQDLLSGFRRGQYDVAFMEHCHLEALSGLHSQDLGQDEAVFFSAGTDLPSGFVSLESLQRLALYVCPARCCTRQLLDKNLESVGVGVESFERVVEPGDVHVIRQSLLDTGGLTFASRALFARDVEEGRFTEHRVEGFEHTRRVVVLAQSEALLAQWADHYRTITAQPSRA